MNTFKKIITGSELVIAGHGRSGSKESTIIIIGHAEAIEDCNLFKKVRHGFLKVKPFLTEQLMATKSNSVFIVPCFASPGSLTKLVIPEKLGLSGPKTNKKNKIIFYTEPVGNHPKILNRICELVKNTLLISNLPKKDTTLIIVGHGSSQNPQSEADTRFIARKVYSLNPSSKVITLFFDQTPNLADWSSYCKTTHAIILSYLFSGGSHEINDIPKLMGFDPISAEIRFTNKQPMGPISVDNKKLWLCPLISADQIIQEVILDRVLEMTKLNG